MRDYSARHRMYYSTNSQFVAWVPINYLQFTLFTTYPPPPPKRML